MSPKRRIIPIFVPHLGCPNDCVFCNQRRISGAKEPATPDTIRSAIVGAAETIPEGAEAAFYGGSFTAIPVQEQEALLNAVLPFLHTGAVSAVRLSTRPDCIDAKTLERLKKYGVKTIELGAQSMVDDVLLRSRRGHTAADTEKAAKLIKGAGFDLILQMMTGLPGDTLERSVYTAEKIAELKPDGVRIYPTVIIKDTELYDMWRDGSYREHTVEEAVEWCSEVCRAFAKSGIPVIRLGLNPTDELSGGAAVGGAYHPAFGELVYSRMYLKTAREKLAGTERGSTATILVSKGNVSRMVGQHRCNVAKLIEEFGFADIKVKEADLEPGEIAINIAKK